MQLSAMHMSYVLMNSLGHTLSRISEGQRQVIFDLFAEGAREAVPNISGKASEEVKAEVIKSTGQLTEAALLRIATILNLNPGNAKWDGPKGH